MTQYRWIVVAYAFVAIIITYLDRTALSYAIGPLEATFHLTNKDFGVIAGAFGLGYLGMTAIGGVLVDYYGARLTWSLFAVLWSLVCMSLGMATGFGWLVALRILLGVTEGPSFPALTRVCTDWLPLSERARALSIGLAAVPFASVLGAPLISQLIAVVGWRWMFVVLGAAGIVWAAFWHVIFRDRPAESKHVAHAELAHIEEEAEALPQLNAMHLEQTKPRTTLKFILFNPAFLANNYAFFAFGYLLFFSITWLPGYLEQTFAIDLKRAGWFLVLPWLTATILLLTAGWISDAVWRKTHSIRKARSHLIWICQLLSALAFIPAFMFSHSLVITLISICFGVGFGMMPNAAFYAINADLARDRAATSLGIMNCATGGAAILAPFLTGWMSSVTGSFSSAILLMIGLMLSSACVILFFQHPDKVLKDKVAKQTALVF
jgi:ACS family hexuronate transporter-like MFS transporter